LAVFFPPGFAESDLAEWHSDPYDGRFYSEPPHRSIYRHCYGQCLASRPLGFLREWSVAHQIGSPLWSSTAVFLTYDDSDGWYDYVMPTIINSSAA